ncbi:MAG: O-antigen ligase family protein [Thermoleophilia bacterium]|nr:O-antigen ligase family protein [Thermoleophilia bacterium]
MSGELGSLTRSAQVRSSPWFFASVVAAEGLILLVALRSPILGVALAAAVGVLALMTLTIGTERGTLAIGSLLLIVTLVLPGDLALAWRLPVGGGGIFVVDLLLALLLASMLAALLASGSLPLVRSPVNLPLFLFLGWVATAGVVGFMRGNDLKLILQDARGLAYYSLFFFIVMFVRSRGQVYVIMRVLAACLLAVFATGAVYAAMGEGMALEFVEPGVSRFPAPDEVFLISSALLATMVVVWPAARRRPVWLWGLLLVALLGLVLSFVRGNYVALAASLFYLLLVLGSRERLRLVAGGLAVAAVLAAGLAVFQPAVLTSVITRTLAVTAVQDRNVQYRFIENQAVGAQIAEHPIVGNGLGKDYLFDWSRYGVAPYRKSYVHNNYYWFVHRLGFIGLGLFAWAALAFLLPWMRDRARLREGDPWLVGLVFGSRTMLVALLVVSITSPRLNGKQSIATLATLIGLAEVARVLLLRGEDEET